MKFASRYENRADSKIEFKEPSKTEQYHKESCDINTILKKYVKSGQAPTLNQRVAQYGDNYNAPNFQKAMDTIVNGQNAFQELPGSLRKRFMNDPKEFLAFMQNKENLEESYKLGLRKKPVVITDPKPDPKPQA